MKSVEQRFPISKRMITGAGICEEINIWTKGQEERRPQPEGRRPKAKQHLRDQPPRPANPQGKEATEKNTTNMSGPREPYMGPLRRERDSGETNPMANQDHMGTETQNQQGQWTTHKMNRERGDGPPRTSPPQLPIRDNPVKGNWVTRVYKCQASTKHIQNC